MLVSVKITYGAIWTKSVLFLFNKWDLLVASIVLYGCGVLPPILLCGISGNASLLELAYDPVFFALIYPADPTGLTGPSK